MSNVITELHYYISVCVWGGGVVSRYTCNHEQINRYELFYPHETVDLNIQSADGKVLHFNTGNHIFKTHAVFTIIITKIS